MSAMTVVKKNAKGRGVYANRDYLMGDTIEVSELLVADLDPDRAHPFDTWTFAFGSRVAIALGTGSLYNHAYDANADWVVNRREKTIRFYAVRAIPHGAEITINYNGLDSKEPVGFKVKA